MKFYRWAGIISILAGLLGSFNGIGLTEIIPIVVGILLLIVPARFIVKPPSSSSTPMKKE